MQLTVRMPDEYAEEIARLSTKLGIRRSDLVRMAMKKFIEDSRERSGEMPFQKVSHLIGIAESGIPDLGKRHRDHLIRIMTERKR
jgi:metal-responsive CopG/Arc/MetJ family transcriptional regulator